MEAAGQQRGQQPPAPATASAPAKTLHMAPSPILGVSQRSQQKQGAGGEGGGGVLSLSGGRQLSATQPSSGGGGEGGEVVEGGSGSLESVPVRGRSWCAAAQGGGATQWAAARGASDALAEALSRPEAAPIVAALSEVAQGTDETVRQTRASPGFERRLAADNPADAVLVGCSNVAPELERAAAATSRLQREGMGGGGEGNASVLVGRRGSMPGRNGIPMILKCLPPPPPRNTRAGKGSSTPRSVNGAGKAASGANPRASKDSSRDTLWANNQRNSRGAGGGGRGVSRGGSGSGGRGGGPGRAPRSGPGENQFKVKIVLGGFARIDGDGGGDNDGGGAGENGNSDTNHVESPLVSEPSSRLTYGGAKP